jgi:hypothetical protein
MRASRAVVCIRAVHARQAAADGVDVARSDGVLHITHRICLCWLGRCGCCILYSEYEGRCLVDVGVHERYHVDGELGQSERCENASPKCFIAGFHADVERLAVLREEIRAFEYSERQVAGFAGVDADVGERLRG